LSLSALRRGSFCDELWSQGACTIALMEPKSEHACATTVKSTVAVNVNAIREKVRLHIETNSTVDSFSRHVKKS
jgi:hypothetical protein